MLNLLLNNQEQRNPIIKDVYTWQIDHPKIESGNKKY